MSTTHIVHGVGKYGHRVEQPLDALKRLVLISGTTRTGKTRLANSLARQQSATLGSGQIIINFKPDPSFIAAKARDAQRLGRSFLHFTLAPSGGGEFRRTHPYEPPKPCHYDPLARGSGALRARMVIDSVVANEQGDVYRRNAIEVAALCWDIAQLAGTDHEIGPNGQLRPRRPLQVLLDMLSLETLEQTAALLTTELIQRRHPHLHEVDAENMVASLQTRTASIKRDATQNTSTMKSAISDTRSIVSQFLNSSAFYPQSLSVGANPAYQIDLLRAIVRGEIVMFSLSAADYRQEAEMLGTLILLDLQNTVSTLRAYKNHMENTLGPDQTPWPPVVLQVEELGTAANSASANALIGLVNKSADVGIRPIASTQSLADIRQIDRVYLQQMLALTSDLVSLQIGARDDDSDFCEFSGYVTKKLATADTEVSSNRFQVFAGAKRSRTVRASDTSATRIPEGAAQALVSDDDGDIREMLWITKTPKLSAVHTSGPEGPNNWYETIQMVPVDEPPVDYRPFADPEEVTRSELAAKLEMHRRLAAGTQEDSLLYRLRDVQAERNDITVAEAVAQPPMPLVELPDEDDGSLTEPDVDVAPQEEWIESPPDVDATSPTPTTTRSAAAKPTSPRDEANPFARRQDTMDPFGGGIDD
ncbi:hypothetical protein [Gordonia alkanivorans]|uniref:hypothetical protein n=1 Tax=Gordonia alkanivorans TaxID=84096 RepID=UPI0004BA5505|nr:hypothetical protein [Gordonia alkanivorans]